MLFTKLIDEMLSHCKVIYGLQNIFKLLTNDTITRRVIQKNLQVLNNSTSTQYFFNQPEECI